MEKADCFFCGFVDGTVDCAKVHDDELVLAFLDNRPINPGHVLIIPKEHETVLFDLDVAVYTRVMDLTKHLAVSVQQVFRPKRVGLVVAGFDVSHAHVHLIPMNDYHDITSKAILENRRGSPPMEELLKHATVIQRKMASRFAT